MGGRNERSAIGRRPQTLKAKQANKLVVLLPPGGGRRGGKKNKFEVGYQYRPGGDRGDQT